MGYTFRLLVLGALVLGPACLSPGSARAEPSPPHMLEAGDVEAFLDGLIPVQLARGKIAGAMVTVVKDDRVLVAKGYGQADVAAQKPVTADTLFRVGSISKTFIALAAMQLVEAGRLDLDRDVAEYLDFQIPSPPGAVPVTMRRLLTHRAGFADTVRGLFQPPVKSEPVLRDYLIKVMPKRIHPDGSVPAYSNFGVAVAAYIIQRLSGQTWADYAETQLLQPLGMTHSSYRQPLSPSLAAHMSKGYRDTERPEIPFEIIGSAPVGALSMSADDAAIYMRALLAGTIPGVSAEGLRVIFSDQVSSPAGTNPMGLIFYGNAIDGTASMGHAGDTIAFHSEMILYPAAKVGLFVSYNSVGGPKARAELQRLFVERYLHTPAPDLGAAPNAADIAAQMTGTWASSRRADDTLIAIAGLIGQITIQGNRDGSLSIEGARDALGQPQPFLPSGPGVWRAGPFGGYRVAMANADGKLVGLTGANPVEQRQRVPAYDSKGFVLPLLGGSVVVLALLIIGIPALGIIKQIYRVPRPRHSAIRLDWGLIYVTSLIQLVMVGGMATIFTRATDDPTILNDALDPYLIAIFGAGWLAAAFSLVLVWSMMKAWANSAGNVMPRLYFSLACLSSLALSAIAIRWHLIGTSLIY